MKIKRLYLLGAWLLLGVSASAQITSIQPQPQQILSQARNLSLPDTYLIVGDTEANTHAVSALKTLLAGKHSDKNGFRIYIGEKETKLSANSPDRFLITKKAIIWPSMIKRLS